MNKIAQLSILFSIIAFSTSSFAHGHSGGHHLSSGCSSCSRDTHGRIKRSAEAKREFKREHPCPANGHTSGSCPGYVADHVQALKHGGADSPSNMQWQTKSEAKAKDKWE